MPAAPLLPTASPEDLLRRLWLALDGDDRWLAAVRFTGAGRLPSAFAVTELAVSTIAAAALAVAETTGAAGPTLTADRRLASLWFGTSLRPDGWALAPAWDAVAGDYAAADGWIRLHTNAPHHRAAALAVLGVPADRAAVQAAVARWPAPALESAVVAAGGCAAAMASAAEWSAHPQGRAVSAEPLVYTGRAIPTGRTDPAPQPGRPLAGVRVLDLTRVLAGPVATRFLAGYGARVLRLDPPDWEEPGVVPDVTLGKRCARLDLRSPAGLPRLRHLLADADILVHGYRPGALDRLGLDAAERQRLRPGLIDISLDAYGWTGPWAGRRGFDSLVQMSSGIAAAGMAWAGRDQPVPLPVQALDHATGYLMAAAAVRGLTRRRHDGRGTIARLSLARVADVLKAAGPPAAAEPLAAAAADDFNPVPEITPWGPAWRLRPPVMIGETAMAWDRPASALGSAPPAWGE